MIYKKWSSKKTDRSDDCSMLMGHEASENEIKEYLTTVRKNPSAYIAQPVLKLFTEPCYIGEKLSPCFIDLKPFILSGKDGIEICSDVLTRLALKKESLVVTSSQIRNSKDTWIIQE